MGILDRFARPYWNVGIVRDPVTRFLDPQFEPQIHWLEPLAGRRFMADPFGAVANGKRYVFCERFDFHANKGDIAYFEIGADLERGPLQTAIALDHHASYPYLFEYESTWYCVPETYQAREVALYAAADFPNTWQRVATLLDNVAANDTSLIRYDGRWWLFCTDYDRGFDSALCIWHAPSLFGPWEPHARNPVKLDKSSACSAGAPFVHEGVLYRPAQDCSRGYGERTVVLRVDNLTPDEFAESPVRTIPPDSNRYSRGLHTLAPLGAWTLVDGLTYKLELDAIVLAARYGTASAARRAGVPEAVVQAAKRAIDRCA
jgi:hypothetical protein